MITYNIWWFSCFLYADAQSMSKIFTKLHNRTRKIKSFILTKFYSKLFYRVGSVKVWGNIEVSYPQNIIVGKNCSINSGVHLNAYNPIVIGDNVTISANSMLISTGLNIEKWLLRAQGDKHIVNEGIYIGNNIWIGANSIILGGGKTIRRKYNCGSWFNSD